MQRWLCSYCSMRKAIAEASVAPLRSGARGVGLRGPLTLRQVWAPVPEMGNGPEGDRDENLCFWTSPPMLTEVVALIAGFHISTLSAFRGFCMADGLEKGSFDFEWSICG